MENKEIDSVLWIGTFVMVVLGMGLIFIVLFYQNYFSKMRRKEAENLLKTALESEKKERQRIAADIHDGVSGDLNAIRNYLSILQRQETDNEKNEMLGEIKSGIEAALENTRLVSYKLMPPLLESAGLITALQDYFQRLTKTTARNFTAEETNNDFNVSSVTAYELFRIIQELTTNMVKYGAVTDCSVKLYGTEKNNVIEITENGMPYVFSELLKNSKGTGLANIRSRIKILEADFNQKAASEGNHFIITLKRKNDA